MEWQGMCAAGVRQTSLFELPDTLRFQYFHHGKTSVCQRQINFSRLSAFGGTPFPVRLTHVPISIGTPVGITKSAKWRIFLCHGGESNTRRQPLQGCALPLSYRGV